MAEPWCNGEDSCPSAGGCTGRIAPRNYNAAEKDLNGNGKYKEWLKKCTGIFNTVHISNIVVVLVR